MKNPMIYNLSGIYAIKCIKNQKIYIGSSIKISDRLCYHRALLKNNKSHNCHLQRAWNKYGEKFFSYHVIEYIDENQLEKREGYWIKYFLSIDKKKCFNFSIDCNRPNLGNKLTIEQLNKLSKAHINIKPDSFIKEKIKNTLIKNVKNKIKLKIINPYNKILKINGLVKFCQQNNLTIAIIRKLLKNEINQYKGWKNLPNQKYIINSIKKRKISLININGKIINSNSIRMLCKNYNLDRAAVSRLLNGKSKMHKGYILYNKF